MCGIAGFIGHSLKPKVSFELITGIFDFLETRGLDASGVWATEAGKAGRVIYHKEPVKSSQFIKTPFWARIKKTRMDCMLLHARATSKGGGHASENMNNHPFVSLDRRIGMVHNGTIEEADILKQTYQTVSETDSEVLLRMWEHGMDKEAPAIDNVPVDIASRMTGIKDIWSCITTGAMAVAIGERQEDARGLLLFRNEKRPLWLADLRQTLGQVFFFSTPDIWYRAINHNTNLKKLCWGTQKLLELPSNQAWHLRIDKDHPTVVKENLFKFNLNAKVSGKEWEAGEYKTIKKAEQKLALITKLPETDSIPKSPKGRLLASGGAVVTQSQQAFWPHATQSQKVQPIVVQAKVQSTAESTKKQSTSVVAKRTDPKPTEKKPEVEEIPAGYQGQLWHCSLCEKIAEIAAEIDTCASNGVMENSVSEMDYQMLVESLDQTKNELEGTLRILRGS